MSVHQTFIIPIIYFFKLLVYTFSFKISLSISQNKINQLNSGIPTRLNKFAWKDVHKKKRKINRQEKQKKPGGRNGRRKHRQTSETKKRWKVLMAAGNGTSNRVRHEICKGVARSVLEEGA